MNMASFLKYYRSSAQEYRTRVVFKSKLGGGQCLYLTHTHNYRVGGTVDHASSRIAYMVEQVRWFVIT